MSLCTSCRLALRQAIRQRRIAKPTAFLSTKASPQEMLSKPTWSIQSLREPTTPASAKTKESGSGPETITTSQLHHLLRLAALPLPKSAAEEEAMLDTLHSQLQFVRAVQRVNTEGVEPLRAIRDETAEAVRENTIGLEQLKEVLAKEALVGHYKRPKRVKEKVESEAENWDALSTASRKAGKYFVVESGAKPEEGG